jgi:hypothetical protein
MTTKSKRKRITYMVASSSWIRPKSERNREVNPRQLAKSETLLAEDGALQAEAERREMHTPVWAMNLERDHEK